MEREQVINNVCVLLGFEQSTAVIEYVVDSAIASLKLILGGEIPEEMTHIVSDVACVRFNRIGSEGLSSHTIEGESMTFNGSDFDGYMDIIEAYMDEQEGTKRGRVRFL